MFCFVSYFFCNLLLVRSAINQIQAQKYLFSLMVRILTIKVTELCYSKIKRKSEKKCCWREKPLVMSHVTFQGVCSGFSCETGKLWGNIGDGKLKHFRMHMNSSWALAGTVSFKHRKPQRSYRFKLWATFNSKRNLVWGLTVTSAPDLRLFYYCANGF